GDNNRRAQRQRIYASRAGDGFLRFSRGRRFRRGRGLRGLCRAGEGGRGESDLAVGVVHEKRETGTSDEGGTDEKRHEPFLAVKKLQGETAFRPPAVGPGEMKRPRVRATPFGDSQLDLCPQADCGHCPPPGCGRVEGWSRIWARTRQMSALTQ